MSIRVAIADDHALVRAGFRVLIEAEPGLEVVGEAADGAEAIELARTAGPDVVLMDIRMPGTDGVAATSQITSHETERPARVLILTTFDLDEYVYAALRAGASGFLLKDTPPADLLAAIRIVAAGDALLAPSVTRKLIREFARQPPASPRPSLGVLTDREQDVLARVARGLSNAEIVDRAVHIAGHRQDPREPAADQAGRAGPRAAHRRRVRVRVRDPGLSPRPHRRRLRLIHCHGRSAGFFCAAL